MATNLFKHGGGGIARRRPLWRRPTAAASSCWRSTGAPAWRMSGAASPTAIRRPAAPAPGLARSPGNPIGFAIYSRPGLGTAVMARLIFDAGRELPSGPGARRRQSRPIPARPFAATTGPSAPARLGRDLAGRRRLGSRARGGARRRDWRRSVFDEQSRRGLRSAGRSDPPRAGADARRRTRGRAHRRGRRQLVRFVGVGNIGAAPWSATVDARRMVSHNGTAGHIAPRIREFTYPFTGSPLVILHSDGLSAQWELDGYPGLAASHPCADRRGPLSRPPARPRRRHGCRDARRA